MIHNKLQSAIPNTDAATSVHRGGAEGLSNQRRAFLCIAIAWVIGTLVFELTANGSEAAPSTKPDKVSHKSSPTHVSDFVQRMQHKHALNEALTSNMDSLLGLSKNDELIARCDAVIADASKTAVSDKKSSPNESSSKLATQTTANLKQAAKNVANHPPQHQPADAKAMVPDSMRVDPILDVMPVSRWITQVAYQQLEKRSRPIGLRAVSVKRLTLDQARTSAIPGLMRLLVSNQSGVTFGRNTSSSDIADSDVQQSDVVIQTVSGSLSTANVVSNDAGLPSQLVPTIAQPMTSDAAITAIPASSETVNVSMAAQRSRSAMGSMAAKRASQTISHTPKLNAPSDQIAVQKTEAIRTATASPAKSTSKTASSQPIVAIAPPIRDPLIESIPQPTPAPTQPLTPTVAKQPIASSAPALVVAANPAANTTVANTTVANNTPSQPATAEISRPSTTVDAPAATEEADLRIAQWPFKKSEPAHAEGANVSLNVQNTDVRSVLEMLARGYGMNILISPDVEGVVTANIGGLSPEKTLQSVLKLCNLRAQVDGDAVFIYPAASLPQEARVVRHFVLDYARAEFVEPAITGLLSPVGTAHINKIEATDNLQTREAVVVVDTPEAVARVESYLYQVDQAPRQVMIEARILEVELGDDMAHGVDLGSLVRGDLTVGANGLSGAVSSTTNPLFFAQVEGSRIDAIIRLLETTTDAKTLATPKVMVVNGQDARIQVGQQLGFKVATTTQTSTIEDVQFLETGVVLSVTPTISRDNTIMMKVKPEVSNGQINPTTSLPEEETRELETSVLLGNHQGVVIGGLIQENDRTVIRKLPWLGDVKHVGKLFQRREATRSRTEVIIALVPHIIELDEHPERDCLDHEGWHTDYDRTNGPLFYGPLQRACRPWEARLPDSAANHSHLDVDRINKALP
ncbi:hypothetical protein [Planctomycetes bacterium K23_9]|uniref:Type IV pilus biogenesis and competence protein PilQ n=1 Tax=Stieleria marina TaxID=1930275 RepID=A0A517NPL9_9BACT|nr:Type IV pilus biogenesis and competence protein PilQ precursor [Planctomycetes bacterium K23_9]